MTPAARERRQVRAPMLWISAAAWSLLVVGPNGMTVPALCSAAMLGAMPPYASLEMLLTLNPLASLAAGWGLMLAAMMVPLLIAPVRHIRDRSFGRRRLRAIVLFVAAYAAVWMVAGVMLLACALTVRLVLPGSWLPVALTTVMAFFWQVSPIKQRFLNRCHAEPQLAAFGVAADLDVLRFGLTHGMWCVGSCWALMLLPMLLLGGHVAAMAAVSFWLYAERLDRPTPPAWRFRGPGKALRIAIAQAWTPPRRP